MRNKTGLWSVVGQTYIYKPKFPVAAGIRPWLWKLSNTEFSSYSHLSTQTPELMLASPVPDKPDHSRHDDRVHKKKKKKSHGYNGCNCTMSLYWSVNVVLINWMQESIHLSVYLSIVFKLYQLNDQSHGTNIFWSRNKENKDSSDFLYVKTEIIFLFIPPFFFISLILFLLWLWLHTLVLPI